MANLVELGSTLMGVLAFALILLPPGYLFAYASDLQGFRRRGLAEQAAWSLTLSFPLAILIANRVGRFLAPNGVLAVFLAVAVAAIVVMMGPGGVAQALRSRRRQRSAWIAAAIASALALAVVLALWDVQIGHRLFLPTTLYDWAVRVPMVRSSIEALRVPPNNPLSSLHGGSAHLRYYYFWYVLCAVPARLAHVSAHNILAASSVWSLLGLLGVLILGLKYFIGAGEHLRRWSLLLLLPFATIGLDILPSLAILLNRHGHLYLDMEWWRNDRTPSFLTSVLYSPHHMAGMVCNLLGFLILATTPRDHDGRREATRSQMVWRGLAVGLCFGACAGTSTFDSLVFVIACLVWTAELLHARQWRHIAMLAGAGVIAYLAARPYLHDLSSGTSAAGGFFDLAWRSNTYAKIHMDKIAFFARHTAWAAVLRQPFVLVLDFFELGFFFFVGVDRLRRDRQRTLRVGERALWAVMIAAGFAALFLSSTITQSANDLGMNAGQVVRLVLVLWSVPWLAEVWRERRSWSTLPGTRRAWIAAAMVCLALGLCGQAYGSLTNRFYFPLLESRAIDRPIDFMTRDQLSTRLFNIREAYRELGRILPADAHIQYDPVGTMSPAMAYFANRQIAASDFGCGTAFGGDFRDCATAETRLAYLYGSAPIPHWVKSVPVYWPATTVATAADLHEACRDLHLNAVLVESTDYIWQQRTSWVWTETPLLANDTVRAFACPAS